MQLYEIKKLAQATTNHLRSVEKLLPEIGKRIPVKGMDERELSLGVNGGYEIVVLFRGHDLPIQDVVEILEAKCYIEPADFFI